MRRSGRILKETPSALRRARGRLGELQPGELALLVQAPVVLPALAVAVRWRGVRRIQGVLATWPRTRVLPSTDGDERRRSAERVAWAVQVTAAYLPWSANCLHRSLTLWWFLRRRGLTGDLRIGVRRDAGTGGLDFHAWVEHDGLVINDRRDVRQRYATFDQAIVPSGVTFR